MDFYYGYFGVFVPIIILWSLFWQILGFWHASRKGHVVWFLVFLIIHTIGILEIIYIFAIEKTSIPAIFDDMKKAYREAHPAHDKKDSGNDSSFDRDAAAGMMPDDHEPRDGHDGSAMQDPADAAADVSDAAGDFADASADASDGGDFDGGSFD
ncbi:MAG TPA: DUF5652 family protein [Candidatus Paceibacterota bacterium]|nr:DUF5652 family protein [Candidatus Paceibacterota bacterium]